MLYRYDPKRFLIRVKLTSVFLVFLLVYFFAEIFIKQKLSFGAFAIIAAVYELFNLHVAICKPSEIEIDDNYLIFRAFKKEHRYEIKDLKYMRIKELADKKLYIRMDNYSLFRGRYWLDTKYYENSGDLYEKLMTLEWKISPEQLKYRRYKKQQGNGKKA